MAQQVRAFLTHNLLTRVRRRRVFGALVMTILPVILVAGSVAFAQDRHDGVIHGCNDKESGRLRVVDGDRRCEGDERSITWNERGRRGEQGPPGADGQPGPEGARGPAGISGFEVVTVRVPGFGLNSDSPKRATAQCPDGKRVVGTAAGIDGDDDIAGRVALQEIAPIDMHQVRGVAAEVASGANIGWAIIAVAFCAETS